MSQPEQLSILLDKLPRTSFFIFNGRTVIPDTRFDRLVLKFFQMTPLAINWACWQFFGKFFRWLKSISFSWIWTSFVQTSFAFSAVEARLMKQEFWSASHNFLQVKHFPMTFYAFLCIFLISGSNFKKRRSEIMLQIGKNKSKWNMCLSDWTDLKIERKYLIMFDSW